MSISDLRVRDLALLALVLSLFAVPALVLLLGEKPGRFSFQMYSGYGLASATWTDRDGTRHRVDLGAHLASDRVEIDWTAFLPEELCQRLPGAVAVEVSRTRPGGVERRSARC